jgi:hypothetical protein
MSHDIVGVQVHPCQNSFHIPYLGSDSHIIHLNNCLSISILLGFLLITDPWNLHYNFLTAVDLV